MKVAEIYNTLYLFSLTVFPIPQLRNGKIGHVVNSTMLNGYIVLIIWRELPVLKRIKVKLKYMPILTFFAIPQLRNAL